MGERYDFTPRLHTGADVHYLSHGSPVLPDGTQAYASQCRAAVVTAVEEEPGEAGGIVSLCVFNPEGFFFNRHVSHAMPRRHVGGTWHWATTECT